MVQLDQISKIQSQKKKGKGHSLVVECLARVCQPLSTDLGTSKGKEEINRPLSEALLPRTFSARLNLFCFLLAILLFSLTVNFYYSTFIMFCVLVCSKLDEPKFLICFFSYSWVLLDRYSVNITGISVFYYLHSSYLFFFFLS